MSSSWTTRRSPPTPRPCRPARPATSSSRTPTARTGRSPSGWVADFLDVPPAHPFHDYVVTLVSNAVAAASAAATTGPTTTTLRQQMAVFLLKAQARPLLRASAVHRNLRRRSLPLHLRRLDRGARRRGHHRRLRRRQLLPAEPGPARPDGRLPVEGRARIRLRAAALRRHLHRRPLPVAIRRLDRAARRRRTSPAAAAAATTARATPTPAARWPCSSSRRSTCSRRSRGSSRRRSAGCGGVCFDPISPRFSRTLMRVDSGSALREAYEAIRRSAGHGGARPVLGGGPSRADLRGPRTMFERLALRSRTSSSRIATATSTAASVTAVLSTDALPRRLRLRCSEWTGTAS